MDREEAISALGSDEPKLRTQATRVLGKCHDREALEALQKALAVERVAFLRRLIPASIERIQSATQSKEPEVAAKREVSTTSAEGQYQKAVHFVSGLLLHEISSKLGLLKYSAQKELAEYENSDTRSNIMRLDAVVSGINSLRDASVSKSVEVFNTKAFIEAGRDDVISNEVASLYLDGSSSLEMEGDVNLLSLAFCNGLKNAAEAVAVASTPQPIVVSWGQTEIENYISILDEGNGITGPQEAAFEIGKTNKKGLSGFGLAIARMAMTTMLGTVNLYPARLGGMRFDMRWPKDG